MGLVAALLVFHPFENPIRYTATLTSTTPPNQAAFLLRGQSKAHIIPIIKQDLGETLRLQLWQRDSQGLTKAIAPIDGNKETLLPSDVELNQGDTLLISVEPANIQKPESITGQILYEGFVVKF
ncbi:hypothetical protein V757_06440 [Pelistega indica]|uniref:Uncharacterized protein n=1 Tax=Pelistega indica TaxID=1414851 RepID=V8G5M9_9BURK|nr:hypothetical protein [Pelistega indica]ETD71720.1 hypothetical protein V757_06440 [Pelistega indica]